MRNSLTKAFWFVKFFFLILSSIVVKMEEEDYCKSEDFKNVAIPFFSVEKGRFHFSLNYY